MSEDEPKNVLAFRSEASPALVTTDAPLPMVLAEGFGDPETLLNSRDWLRKAIETAGAKVGGGGIGLGQADLDFTLDGCKFNVSLRPL